MNIDIVKLLIESKLVDINIQDKDDNTALLIAVKQKNTDIVEKLLAKGANANIHNIKNEMPIIMALNSIGSRNSDFNSIDSRISPKIIMDLINSGADVNYVSRDEGKTPLHLASEIRYLADVVNELITKGANVNALTVNGETPLYIASRSNNIDIVKTLLNNNADVNIATNKGSTPIKVAYNDKYYELVNFLLENGAAADKETMEKIRTQIDYANKKKEEAEAQASKDHRRRMGEGGGRKTRKPRKTRKKYNKRINVIKSKNKYSKKYHN